MGHNPIYRLESNLMNALPFNFCVCPILQLLDVYTPMHVNFIF